MSYMYSLLLWICGKLGLTAGVQKVRNFTSSSPEKFVWHHVCICDWTKGSLVGKLPIYELLVSLTGSSQRKFI